MSDLGDRFAFFTGGLVNLFTFTTSTSLSLTTPISADLRFKDDFPFDILKLILVLDGDNDDDGLVLGTPFSADFPFIGLDLFLDGDDVDGDNKGVLVGCFPGVEP